MTEVAVTRSAPPERVPTLTEVLDPRPGRPAASAPANEGDELVQGVLTRLQGQMDEVLSQRLSASLEPLVQELVRRSVTDIVDAVRAELASTLREQVSLAMAHEKSRHRSDEVPR